MSPDESEAFHSEQIRAFADTTVDFVGAPTMNNVPEAIGIVRQRRMAAYFQFACPSPSTAMAYCLLEYRSAMRSALSMRQLTPPLLFTWLIVRILIISSTRLVMASHGRRACVAYGQMHQGVVIRSWTNRDNLIPAALVNWRCSVEAFFCDIVILP